MKADGDYEGDGYVSLPGLVPKEVTQAFLGLLKSDLDQSGVPLESLRQGSHLLKGDSIELYAYHYPPMLMFLWGLTPTMTELTGHELLPTYAYLRIYKKGDICRVHSDRHSCQHSLSLLLASSDDLAWPLEIGKERLPEPSAKVSEDFEAADHASIPMQAGDAVLYKGTNHRHGRITPNPNAWSAHLFLHWVDREGPYASFAFDGQQAYLKPLHFG